MTSRIDDLFSKDKARIAYLTVGDGGIQKTLESALALIEGGVNLLELGIPFSDPIADGPVIQRAEMRALEQGTTLDDVLLLIQRLREKTDIPLILFSYLNPILAGLKTGFIEKAKDKGIDGLLVVDCPLEESHEIEKECMHHGLKFIQVIAESTPLARIQEINKRASGFLYYACRKGTTGVQNTLPSDFSLKIQTIKENVTLPVVVGFGVSTSTMVKNILKKADGVVVGSFFVKMIEEGTRPDALKQEAKLLYFGASYE